MIERPNASAGSRGRCRRGAGFRRYGTTGIGEGDAGPHRRQIDAPPIGQEALRQSPVIAVGAGGHAPDRLTAHEVRHALARPRAAIDLAASELRRLTHFTGVDIDEPDPGARDDDGVGIDDPGHAGDDADLAVVLRRRQSANGFGQVVPEEDPGEGRCKQDCQTAQ